ncbi:MAG: DUF1905 domain-containing protein [Bacteroidetes bacterium]|nr:DUF1905 domain-containing protein [Bacteroidota bacterium]
MVQFPATILQFAEMGEKTGWSYIKIPIAVSEKLIPGNKKSFRVKGKLDDYEIKGVSLLPMGEGQFIMALNANIRKAIKKNKGMKLLVQLELDSNKPKPPTALIDCLKDEPEAYAYFKSLPLSHQNYFGNWIKSAKTDTTKAKRIVRCVEAMRKKFNFAEMIRSVKVDKEDFLREL